MEVIRKNWTDSEGNHQGGQDTGIGFTIAWQRGGVKESGRNGAFVIEVLESCLAQVRYFQEAGDGKFACQENKDAIFHMEEALIQLNARRSRRLRSGKLGTQEPD